MTHADIPSKALLAPALLAVLACGGDHPAPQGAAPEPIRAATASVDSVPVEQQVVLTGRVEAGRLAAVSARVMASVTAVHVAAGDAVGRGQLLLEIDPQAAEGQVSQASGALAQARAALALAERNHERYSALAARNAASALELDMARSQHEQARGAVEQAEGAVASARAVASDSRVVAPFAGRVAQRLVDVGDLAAPGRPLLMIESEASRRLRVAVPESVVVAAGLALDDHVPVTLDAHPGLGELDGRVVEMTPGADPASLSYGVAIELPAVGLPTGAAGRARVTIGRRDALAVPPGAVLERGGMRLVAVVGADGTSGTRVVTLGQPLADGRIEVLSGLAAGETVLVGLGSVPAAGTPVQTPDTEGGEAER